MSRQLDSMSASNRETIFVVVLRVKCGENDVIHITNNEKNIYILYIQYRKYTTVVCITGKASHKKYRITRTNQINFH